MSGMKSRRKPKPQDQPKSKAMPPAAFWVCLVTAAAAVAGVWAVPRPIGDLYISLAAGRDIMAGKLACPDDWSFMTAGRVWINQNWGTHLLTYVSYRLGGDTGLLVFKAVLILAVAVFLTLVGRRRGVSWPVAILVAGGTVIATRSYVDLRPNLTSLVFTSLVLWTLYLTLRRTHVIWVSAALVAIWSNMHGGFVFGIGMLGLWALARVISSALREGVGESLRRYWPLLAAPLAAVVLAGLAGPFGIKNLTHPLVVARSEVWRGISEWRSVFVEAPFGTTWEFFAATGLLVALTLIRFGFGRRGEARKDGPSGVVPFEVLLALVAIAMACQARRFVPVALIVIGPLLAGQVQWATRAAKAPWLVIALALGLAMPTGLLWRNNSRRYDPDNPLYERETFFQRMHSYSRAFAPGAARFINENGLSARVFSEWRWEGFLRWLCPQLKVYMGGRAQAVYDEKTKLEYDEILSEGQADRILAGRGVHLVVVPWGPFVDSLVLARNPRWAFVYADSRAVVLADAVSEDTAALVRLAAEGKLKYPDGIAAALSRAFCLNSPALQADPAKAIGAIVTANRIYPFSGTYSLLAIQARKGNVAQSWLIEYLENENQRLAGIPCDRAEGALLAHARLVVLDMLVKTYVALGRTVEASQLQFVRMQQEALLKRIAEKWEF
jgi:hypothetical protein